MSVGLQALEDGEPGARTFVRRARPALGTLVEVGVALAVDGLGDGQTAADAVAAAFKRIAVAESALSRFDPRSPIHRFNAAPEGARVDIGIDACRVLAAAQALADASDGLFDVSLGSGRHGWRCDGQTLCKLDGGAALDLGGIAKGYIVDRAVEALQQHGVAAGWVNAGGDLRVFGRLSVPVDIRDERHGGVRRFAMLEDGAFATSRLGARHVSVAAAECLWADALTKLVAASGDPAHRLLASHGARAWLH